MMVAGFSYSATQAFAAVLHTPTASASLVSPPAVGFAPLVQRLRCHHREQPSKRSKEVKVRMSFAACSVALALRSAVGRSFFGHREHCGGVAPPASYLGHEQPGSAVEAEAGAGCRPRTVTGGAVRRSPWTDMGAVRALEEGEASEHHNIPRRRARLRLLVRLGGALEWTGSAREAEV